MKLDTGQAWTEAMAMLKGQREILLTIAGAFFLLPAMLLNALNPFASPPDANSIEQLTAAYSVWVSENWPWLLIVALLAVLGRLAILILLLAPERPTVGQALAAGAAMLLVAFILNILIGFLVGAGLLLFIIPGFYLFARSFLAETLLVAERLRSPVRPIARAFEVSKGNGWRIFFLVAIIWLAIQFIAGAVGTVAGIFAALNDGTGLATFFTAFFAGLASAAGSLLFLLLSVAIYRQLSGFRR